MKKTLFATLLGLTLAAASAPAAVRFGIGVNIGGRAPVVAAHVAVRPPMPNAGCIWVDGYNGPNGFVAGYWATPPFSGAYWVAPSFTSGRFVAGYWGGNRIADRGTNFRAEPFNDRDNHFRAPAHDDHFRGNDRDGRFNNRFNDRVDDHGRDFRR